MSHRPFMPAPYAMAAGATPNEMTSASESSSRPIAECTRRERATRPSSTSSARATGMSAAAASSRCGLRVSRYRMTEIIGCRQVAELKNRPFKMRFYSGLSEDGDVSHHDLALAEAPPEAAGQDSWTMQPRRIGLNHVAIAWPDRESWLRQLEFLQKRGVKFLRRVNHGMTHSVYIQDPDGHGIEVLYELPRPVWENDIDGAQNFSQRLPTEGPEALVDTTDNPVFGGAKVSA